MNKLFKSADGGAVSLLIPGSIVANVSLLLRQVNVISRNGADHWLMVFAGTVVPANGSYPLCAATLVQANFVGELDNLEGMQVPAPGCVLVISTTNVSLTAAAGTAFDISALVEDWEDQVPGLSTAGDLSSSVASLQVWADADGPKFLYRIEVNETSGSNRWLMLFAKDASSNGDQPLMTFYVPASTKKTFDLGRNGFSPFLQEAFVTYDACRLVFSSTGGSLTTVAASGNIKAYYK